MLDAHWRLVLATEAALSALACSSNEIGSCASGGACHGLEGLIDALVNGGFPNKLVFSGFVWRRVPFLSQNGAQHSMTALVLGPAAPISFATTLASEFRLTARETEAFESFMEGLSAKEVAAKMQISTSTAKAFLRMITAKMGVSGRAGMMSKVLNCMCAASLTCPFQTSFSPKQSTNPQK